MLILTWLLACGSPTPPPEPPPPPAEVAPGSLKDIMRGLAADMRDVDDGLWTEDHAKVAAAARKIADHPEIPEDEVASLKTRLGETFEVFERLDASVHQSALDLAAAADKKDLAAELKAHDQLENGCVACHTTVRDPTLGVPASGSPPP